MNDHRLPIQSLTANVFFQRLQGQPFGCVTFHRGRHVSSDSMNASLATLGRACAQITEIARRDKGKRFSSPEWRAAPDSSVNIALSGFLPHDCYDSTFTSASIARKSQVTRRTYYHVSPASIRRLSRLQIKELGAK
jgi:hypothetical protein